MKALQFLNPIMLGGLLLIAVPVIIHLISRMKAKRVDFATIRFLEQIKITASRMERLRHLILLILRILLIGLIALAFARPFFSNKTGKWTSGSTKAAVIILDNSYSMGYGNYFQKGVTEALKLASEYTLGDKLAVISGSERPRIVLQMTDGGKGAETAIKAMKISNLSTDFENCIRLAEEMLMEASVSRKTIYIITDNQDSGWAGMDFKQKLSPGVDCKLIKITGKESGNKNCAITGVELSSEGGRLFYNKVKARVFRFGEDEAAVKVELEIDGVRQEKRLSIKPRQSAVVEFTVDMKLDKPHQGSVRIEDNSLKTDNRYYFSAGKALVLPLLLLSEKTGSQESVYLNKALSPMEAKGIFKIKEKTFSDFTSFEGEKYSAIFVVGVKQLKESSPGVLKKYVEEGGTLIIIPEGFAGEDELKRYNKLFKGLLPAELKSVEGGTENWNYGFGLSPRLLDNPVLEGITDPKYADWSEVTVIKYIKTAKVDGNVILSYDNGDAAFIEKRTGKGRTLFFTSSLDGTWNNFVLTPIFLPFIHQTVYTSAEEAGVKPVYFTGDSLSASPEEVIRITTPGGRELKNGEEAEEPGIYKFERKDKTFEYISVNVKGAEEGDLTYGMAEEKEEKLKNPSNDLLESKSSLELWSKKEEEEKQRFWWYLALLALLAGTAEMMIANYRGKR